MRKRTIVFSIIGLWLAVLCGISIWIFMSQPVDNTLPFWSAFLMNKQTSAGSFEIRAKVELPPQFASVGKNYIDTVNRTKISGTFAKNLSSNAKKMQVFVNANILPPNGIIIPQSIYIDADISDEISPLAKYVLESDALTYATNMPSSYVSMNLAKVLTDNGMTTRDSFEYMYAMQKGISSLLANGLSPESRQKFVITNEGRKYKATIDEESLKQVVKEVLLKEFESDKYKQQAINEAFEYFGGNTYFDTNAVVIEIELGDTSVSSQTITVNFKANLYDVLPKQHAMFEKNTVTTVSISCKTMYDTINGAVNVPLFDSAVDAPVDFAYFAAGLSDWLNPIIAGIELPKPTPSPKPTPTPPPVKIYSPEELEEFSKLSPAVIESLAPEVKAQLEEYLINKAGAENAKNTGNEPVAPQ